MSRNTLDSVIAYIRTDRSEPIDRGTDGDPKPVITIARDHGAGGEEIGQILARTLEVGYFDKELIDRVVEAAGTDKALMKALDERVKNHLGVFLYASLYGLEDPIAAYKGNLIKAVTSLSRMGGVIMGRGANLILHGKPVLRVRVIGSPHICARRLAAANGPTASGQPHDETAARIEAVNAERAKFVWDLFGIRSNDPVNYDLVLNTDHFTNLADAADLILHALRLHALARKGSPRNRDAQAALPA